MIYQIGDPVLIETSPIMWEEGEIIFVFAHTNLDGTLTPQYVVEKKTDNPDDGIYYVRNAHQIKRL